MLCKGCSIDEFGKTLSSQSELSTYYARVTSRTESQWLMQKCFTYVKDNAQLYYKK